MTSTSRPSWASLRQPPLPMPRTARCLSDLRTSQIFSSFLRLGAVGIGPSQVTFAPTRSEGQLFERPRKTGWVTERASLHDQGWIPAASRTEGRSRLTLWQNSQCRYRQTRMNPYMPIVVLVAIASVLCIAMVTLSWLLGPKKATPYKESAFECGVEPLGNARERFPVKFYLTAMLFILFDIEVVFLWSWMTVFRDWVDAGHPAAMYSFVAVMVYMFLWFLGDIYVLRSGALEWEESKSLHPEKLGESQEPDDEADLVFPVSREVA